MGLWTRTLTAAPAGKTDLWLPLRKHHPSVKAELQPQHLSGHCIQSQHLSASFRSHYIQSQETEGWKMLFTYMMFSLNC